MVRPAFLFGVVDFLWLLPLVDSRCYFPDGKSVANFDTPCHSDGNSTCCGQGYACMSNDICKLTSYVLDQSADQSTYVRGSCTDPTWSGVCPNFCTTPSHGDTDSGGMGMQKCEDNSEDTYFCLDAYVASATISISGGPASASAAVCSSSNYLVQFQGTPTTVTIIGVTTTTSTTSSSTPTTLTSAASSAAGSSNQSTPKPISSSSANTGSDNTSGKNLSVAVGAGVGVPLGVIAISLIAFFIWRYRRTKRANPNQTHSRESPAPGEVFKSQQQYAPQTQFVPPPSNMYWERGTRHELPVH